MPGGSKVSESNLNETPRPLLEVQALEAVYGRLQVLFGINPHVLKGEIVSVIGPNGAGKSTVIKAVIGLVTVTGGRIFFHQQGE